MRDKTDYIIIEFSKAVLFFGIIVLSFIALGFYSFLTLEHEGHWLTGMNNQGLTFAEMGVTDDPRETSKGIPFIFLARDKQIFFAK